MLLIFNVIHQHVDADLPGRGEEVPRLPESIFEAVFNIGVLFANPARGDALQGVDELCEVGGGFGRELDVNVVGATVDVLYIGLEVLCNLVGNFGHASQPLIGENVGPVLRDGYKVRLERVDCVRPGLQVVLYLASRKTIHPSRTILVPVGIPSGRPAWTVAPGLRGSRPPWNGGILSLNQDSLKTVGCE
ncbi:Vng6222h (plasmid) [Halobacterium salinarum NRC-1]|uniref:Spurious ORF n=1 Tax=Halobacterium salinarum (strain ATCC 700922 / JCM 11081 / NRC-1) TaxID=64091 RepID=Q9HHU5_HALSA|nr:Vng6222h [Halobacterium salinarum NRC-1]DAC79845.1 TPA_inf: spurious ORF [Halobacterium salinarum NRC-1]